MKNKTQEPVGGMKWVKLSERRPKAPKRFVVRKKNGDVFTCPWFLNSFNNGDPDIIEWLDDNYTPPPIKTEGEDEIIKQVGYIKRNAEKINEHTWKVYKEQILLHIEEIETTYSPPSPVGIDVDALRKKCADFIGTVDNCSAFEIFMAGYSAPPP